MNGAKAFSQCLSFVSISLTNIFRVQKNTLSYPRVFNFIVKD